MPIEQRHEEIASALIQLLDSSRKSTRGFTIEHRESERQAVYWLIEALFQAWQHAPSLPLALPLKYAFYGPKYPHPVPLSFSAVNRLVQVAESNSWIRVARGSHTRHEVTRIWPKGPLLRAFNSGNDHWCLFPATPRESLVLMTINSDTGEKRIVEVDEHELVALWRDNLFRINEFLLGQCIYLDMPDEDIHALGRRKITQGNLWFAKVELRRVFNNGSLDFGGRFYGGWWQNFPSHFRDLIRINGDPVVEVDFSAMAIRCLYARRNLVPPDDPYDIGYGYTSSKDPRRAVIKRFLNAVLNDSTGRFRLSKEQLDLLGEKGMRSLRRRVLEHLPILNEWLHSGVGLELQHLESQIAEHVMLKLLEHAIVCLPIHDSFIVAKQHEASLISAMGEAFERFTGKPAKLKSDYGCANVGMWFIPHPQAYSDEDILSAWNQHTEECYSIAMNYFIGWKMATCSPDQIDSAYRNVLAIFRDITRWPSSA